MMVSHINYDVEPYHKVTEQNRKICDLWYVGVINWKGGWGGNEKGQLFSRGIFSSLIAVVFKGYNVQSYWILPWQIVSDCHVDQLAL